MVFFSHFSTNNKAITVGTLFNAAENKTAVQIFLSSQHLTQVHTTHEMEHSCVHNL